MAEKKAAGKKKVSKTQAIRAALKSTKGGSPTLVAKKLNAKGIDVTPQYVSTIKASDKRKANAGTPARRPGRPVGSGAKSKIAATNGSQEPFDDLKQASELVLKAVELVLKAGAKEAKHLVGIAANMVDRISDNKS